MKLRWIVGLCLPLLLAGCATTPDWNNRVGCFTYDQAVAELGEPDMNTKRPDGSTEAFWIVERGTPATVGNGMGGAFASPGLAPGPQFKREFPARPDRCLRLTFGPDRVLKLWQEDRRVASPTF